MQDERQDREIDFAVLERKVLQLTLPELHVRRGLEAKRGGGEHLLGAIDADDPSSERRERLRQGAGAHTEIRDGPVALDEPEQRKEVGGPAEELLAHFVPPLRGAREEFFGAQAPPL